MTKSILICSSALAGSLLLAAGALAADYATSGQLPAVSAINGKVEFGGGYGNSDSLPSDEMLYGLGSLSVPLGQSFGFQADVGVIDAFGETTKGAAGHLFTRNPDTWLIGAIGGYVDNGALSAYWVGAEAELYHGNVSMEVSAAYLGIDPDALSNQNEFLATADLGYYASENLRLSLGASTVADFESVHAGFEWMIDSMPVSLSADLRLGEDDLVSAGVGLSFYFGGNDPAKTLMRRHREDDPANDIQDIFGNGAAGDFGGVLGTCTATPPQFNPFAVLPIPQDPCEEPPDNCGKLALC
jgi:hypothetical protein